MGGELGKVRQYQYWSERLVKEIAESNSIDLSHRSASWSFSFRGLQRTPPKARETLFRDELAKRIAKAIGQRAVGDPVAPGPEFVQAVGDLDMFRFVGGHPTENAAGMCTRIFPSEGPWIDVCLFGSLHNFLDRIRAAEAPNDDGWWSSSAPWIQELLESRGQVNTWSHDPDDYESIAVEILKVCVDQGQKDADSHDNAPETRSFTLGRTRRAEFFASIFLDVTLTPERWGHDGYRPFGAHRIMVGFPLWVRTNGPESLIVYTPEMRREAESKRQRHLDERRERGRLLIADRALEQRAPDQGVSDTSIFDKESSEPA